MYNLTITIWRIFDENDPKTSPAGEITFDDRGQNKLGFGAPPPDK